MTDTLTRCPICGRPLRTRHYGRPRRYCSDACKQYAYRTRLDGPHGAQRAQAYSHAALRNDGPLRPSCEV